MKARLQALLRKSGEWIAPIAAVSMVFVLDPRPVADP
jgi:hypothetical protein